MIKALENRLNDLLKTKNSFKYECTFLNKNYTYTYDDNDIKSVTKLSPTLVILELNKLKYNFSRKQFDKFIERICDGGTLCSYAFTKVYNYGYDDYRNECINTMLNLFDLSDNQLDMIFKCITKKNYPYIKNINNWLSVLINKKYKFSNDQLLLLKDLDYNVNDAFMNVEMDLESFNNNFINNYKSYNHINLLDYDINLIKSIIKKNNIVPTTQSILNIISSNHYSDINLPKNIKMVQMIINCLIECGAIFTKECADNIYDSFFDIMFNSYNYKKEFKEINIEIINLINFISSLGYAPTIEFVKKLTNYEYGYQVIFYIIDNYLDLSTENLNSILETMQTYVHVSKIDIPFDSTTQYCVTIDKDEDHSLSSESSSEDNNNNNEDEKEDDDKDNCHISTVLYILGKGIIPDIETLKIVCRHNDTFSYNILTKEYKIYPNNSCLSAALKSYSDNADIIIDILNYKITPDLDNFKIMIKFKGNVNNILDLFVKSGLELTFDMIDYALYYNTEISNLNKFKIKNDEELYFLCYKNDYFCYEFSEIDQNILKMRKMCRNPKTNPIKFFEFIKNNNIKLDKYCVEYANRFNKNLSKILFKHFNCEPTIGCLLSNKKHQNSIKFFKEILNKYGITANVMAQPLDLDISGYLSGQKN